MNLVNENSTITVHTGSPWYRPGDKVKMLHTNGLEEVMTIVSVAFNVLTVRPYRATPHLLGLVVMLLMLAAAYLGQRL